MRFKLILSALLACAATAATADEQALEQRFAERLKGVLPEVNITSVKPAPVPGLYEVMLGGQVLYMTEDGRHVVRGDVYDLDAQRNVTEDRRAEARLDAFAALGTESMIEFAPPGKPKHVVYVFTDVDCGYCRKMHSEIDQLTSAGVAVRYLAYPRAGIGSEAYDSMVSAWCAGDRQQALTDIKAGKPIPPATCDNPIDEHFRLGNVLGVQGTPTIILESGKELGGYAPAPQLIEILEAGS